MACCIIVLCRTMYHDVFFVYFILLVLLVILIALVLLMFFTRTVNVIEGSVLMTLMFLSSPELQFNSLHVRLE
jgi:hypothetical protein